MADQTADSPATSGFGSSIINAVRRVFGGPGRWRALSDAGGDSVSSLPGDEHQQDVASDGKSDLNGNESTMKLPLDDESVVIDAAVQTDVLCRRCLWKLKDDVTTSIDLLAASRYLPPSSTAVCGRCGDRLPPSDASWTPETCSAPPPPLVAVGEPVCACDVCSRTRAARMRSSSVAAGDMDSWSSTSSSSCSTSSLTVDLTSTMSSDVCLASAEVKPGRRAAGSRRPPGKTRMCHSKTTPTVSSSCADSSTDYASSGIVIPGSRRHQPRFVQSPPPALPPVPDPYLLPPHIAISPDGEEDYARAQRRIARINHRRRVGDLSASNTVVVPPNRTVRHLTDLDT